MEQVGAINLFPPKNYIIYLMQPKKAILNPEVPAVFTIRKVNKKPIGIGKNMGQGPYYTPEVEHEKLPEYPNYSCLFHSEVADPRKEKEMVLDQTVNEAIINSKAYGDLKRTHIENKKRNAERKSKLEEEIAKRREEKQQALRQQEKLQIEKQKYMEAISGMREKIDALRETNERYREALSNRVSGEAEYISNLIMSMRFQAEYQHDIDPDQMTYQQLLELEEKIGCVSRGLPPHIIAQLPKIDITEQSEQKCMVCFSNYEEGEVSTKIPSCQHVFHFQCLESWLGKEKVCPLCKKELQFDVEQEEEEE